MNTTPSTFADAVGAHLAAVEAAEAFTDDDLTPEAVQRKRAEMHRDAQAVLAARVGELPDPGDDPRREALDALRATGADQIAAEQRELGIVRELLDSGRELGRIIANADATRAAAILTHREVIALDSPNSEAAAAEIADAVFARLEQIGHPEAVAAADRLAEWEAATARRDVLHGIQQGGVPLGSFQALSQAAPDDYAAAQPLHAAQAALMRSAREARRMATATAAQ